MPSSEVTVAVMGRLLIPCPFTSTVLSSAKTYGGSFKGHKQVRGLQGTRAQIAACTELSQLIGNNVIINSCMTLLRTAPFGKIDAVGIDFKDKVLDFGTVEDAVSCLSLQVTTPLVEAELYVQTLTVPDETMCFITGWLYRPDVARLGRNCGGYVQVPLVQTYDPADLVDILKKRYP